MKFIVWKKQAKEEKKQMKKLMIAAAVAAMTAASYAEKCGEDPIVESCQTVFTIKFSGKTTNEYETKKDEYKKIQKLSAKGYLVMAEDYVVEDFTSFKVGQEVWADSKQPLVIEPECVKCTYFGKDLYKVVDTEDNPDAKPGKTYKLESDLALAYDEDFVLDQVAFGKVKVYITKGKDAKKKGCGETPEVDGCIPVLTPVSYSGWFTGSYDAACLDEEAYNDGCNELDDDAGTALIGGTWSAKYSKKYSK